MVLWQNSVLMELMLYGSLGSSHRPVQFRKSDRQHGQTHNFFVKEKSEQHGHPKTEKAHLGGCFKHFSFSPLPGEMIQFD